VQLVPEALDVIHAIGYDYVVAGQQALHSGHLGSAGILLRSRGMIYLSLNTERLIVDMVHLDLCDPRVGRGDDFGGEELAELLTAMRLA
jgi:hypothetical protein